MKNIFFIFFLVFISNNLKSQISDLHFGVNVKTKLEMMDIIIPNEDLRNNPYYFGNSYWSFSANITYNRFLIGLEYFYEDYQVGAEIKNSKSEYGYNGSSNIAEYGNHFGLLINYYLFPVEKKFNILPGIGLSYLNTSNSSSYSSERLKEITRNGEVKVIEYLNEQTIEGTNYIFLKPNVEFSYTPFSFLTLFFNSGYNFGFKTIGSIEGWYKIEDKPKMNFKNSTKGNSIYFSLGTRINFSLNKDKGK